MTSKASEHAAAAMPQLRIPVLAVVGVGLIGGSMALSLKRCGVVGKVLGISHDPASINKALELGIVDVIASFEDISQADVIVIATPVSAFESVCSAIKPFLAPHSIITDVCSTKQQVAAMARRVLGDRVGQFVPGHPIAGAETSGPAAANAFLFEQKQVILAPLQENAPEQIALLTRLWEACGSTVSSMSAEKHDRIFAAVSHMPHFLSALYMYSLLDADQTEHKLKYAGSGFRDFTRIAAGAPIMWRDIFSSNRECMLEEITRFQTCLEQARQLLESGNNEAFEAWLTAAAQARRDWENPRS
ncbi:MAG TPA: prephenate dehydrogenase/arogenate dehydrogenase family protein [Advenella sp.]|nr:prephenate dehydrogenase/arogenate dehydrogenase family protein [Advenella sp.]